MVALKCIQINLTKKDTLSHHSPEDLRLQMSNLPPNPFENPFEVDALTITDPDEETLQITDPVDNGIGAALGGMILPPTDATAAKRLVPKDIRKQSAPCVFGAQVGLHWDHPFNRLLLPLTLVDAGLCSSVSRRKSCERRS